MCHFITALVPPEADRDALIRRTGWREIENPSVRAQIGPADLCLLTTRAMCDCGTPLGSLAERNPAAAAGDLDAEARKRRKQGWSEAKIRRWLAEKSGQAEKQGRVEAARTEQAARDVRRWVDLLTEILHTGLTPRIGLLLHWYRMGVETERVPIKRQEWLDFADLTGDRLLRIEEDVVYHFAR